MTCSFINGLLANSVVWYGTKKKHITALEATDADLMRMILGAHSKTAIELLYLESGRVPLEHVMPKRSFMFLWTILKRNKDYLTRKVYDIQKVKKTTGDWYLFI